MGATMIKGGIVGGYYGNKRRQTLLPITTEKIKQSGLARITRPAETGNDRLPSSKPQPMKSSTVEKEIS